MTHDPLCPSRDLRYDYSRTELRATNIRGVGLTRPCHCSLISKVRADELQRATTAKATVHVCADNNCWCRVLAAIREAKP